MNCGARDSDVEQALSTGTLVLILLNIYSTAYSTVATIVCKVLVLIYLVQIHAVLLLMFW